MIQVDSQKRERERQREREKKRRAIDTTKTLTRLCLVTLRCSRGGSELSCVFASIAISTLNLSEKCVDINNSLCSCQMHVKYKTYLDSKTGILNSLLSADEYKYVLFNFIIYYLIFE